MALNTAVTGNTLLLSADLINVKSQIHLAGMSQPLRSSISVLKVMEEKMVSSNPRTPRARKCAVNKSEV